MLTAGGVNLSIGERQCIALARCCFSPASVLLLDEITSGLDQRSAQAALAIIRRELCGRQNKAVLFIAHRLADLRCCDELYLLEGGRVAMHGEPETVIAELTRQRGRDEEQEE